MDAIIMCAGLGTRLRPITNTIPKPLVPIAGRSSLERTLDVLPACVTGVILVIGYLGNLIRDRIGATSNGRPVRYVVQDPLDGTGGALRRARGAIASDRFLVLNGDDLYGADDLKEIAQYDHAILYSYRVMEHPVDEWIVNEDGNAVAFSGAPPGKRVRVNCGAYALTHVWFETVPVLVPGKTTEWSLPHALPQLITKGITLQAVPARFWMQVGTPEQLARAEELLGPQGVIPEGNPFLAA